MDGKIQAVTQLLDFDFIHKGLGFFHCCWHVTNPDIRLLDSLLVDLSHLIVDMKIKSKIQDQQVLQAYEGDTPS